MKKVLLFIICAIMVILAACGSTITSSSPTPAPTPVFTNIQGTPTTKCAEPGCDNYIASSGDTAYCTDHSSTCLFCEKYLDKDALFICDDCWRELDAEAEAEKEISPSNSFTNKYGTPSTKCAHYGCNNYIASSGDTNCCALHSNRCLNCGKYIDEDASYCMTCIEEALYPSSGNSSNDAGKTVKCNYCNGTGRADGGTCPWCNGSGTTYDNAFNDWLG